MSGNCRHNQHEGFCGYCDIEKRDRGKKTFLECMYNDLDDISEGTDEEVVQELEALGVDIEKTKQSFMCLIEKLKRKDQK